MAGVTVRERWSAPVLEGCALHGGEEGGLLVLDGGGGRLVGCAIERNREVGVEVKVRPVQDSFLEPVPPSFASENGPDFARFCGLGRVGRRLRP